MFDQPASADMRISIILMNCETPGALSRGLCVGKGISDGYKFPRKQGVDDGRYISAMGLTATNVRPQAEARAHTAI